MTQQRPDRVLGGGHTEFWDHCKEGTMRLQQCDDCSSWMWPPAPVCDGCLSSSLTWSPVSGLGTIHAYCVFERSYFTSLPAPWPVILVELEEGPIFVSNPHDIGLEDLSVGLPVKVDFLDCVDRHGDYALPVFTGR